MVGKKETSIEFREYVKKSYFANRYLYASKFIEDGKTKGPLIISALVLKEDITTQIMGNTDTIIVNNITPYINALDKSFLNMFMTKKSPPF